jgi:hypothetical protein
MRSFGRYLLVTSLFLSSVSQGQATQLWSSCQTIIGVSNYLAANSSIYLALSPGITGCSPNGIDGAVVFGVGTDGVTAANITSFLAASLTALAAGQRVMIYYDNATVTCAGIIIANNGYAGQC